MGNYSPCSRQHCRHDSSEHRQAPAGLAVKGDRLLIGACHHRGCLCAQYVEMGLRTGNDMLESVYGDHGRGAPLRVVVPLPTMYGPDGRPLH